VAEGILKMAKRHQFKRVVILALLLCAGLLLLGYRLVDLQVLRHDELSEKAERSKKLRVLREPRRGEIRGIRGDPLATSVFVKTVCADPTLLSNRVAEVASTVAPLLQLDVAETIRRLQPQTREGTNGSLTPVRYVVLKHKVLVDTWEKVQAAMANLNFGVDEKHLTKAEKEFYQTLRQKAVFADPQDAQLRLYPNQSLAAHVLGYVGTMEKDYNGRPMKDLVGMDGMERAMNSKLAGVRGWLLSEVDSRKREQVTLRQQDVEAQDGCNVVLTVDSVVQNIVETALQEGMKKHNPISISSVVIRPRTGEILAMATLPTFDPNNLAASTADARRNRVIADLVEPGSTFKIVVLSGALNDGKTTLNERFFCENGAFQYAGRTLHDHEAYGWLTAEQIITKSSNIGAAKIGIKLGQERLYDYIRDFGFATRTGITLPGEVNGIVHPTKFWYPVSIAQIPMGHGVCVTPLQMAMAMAAIANGGVLMRPMIIDRLEDPDGQILAKYGPQRMRQVIGTAASKQMVQALKTVVTKEGTAPKAALEHYTVAGKTGTAQKVENGQYVRGKYISSFIGFFPADNPELCISVVLDEPKGSFYGGQTAAPLFHQIAERAASYLNIRPDRLEEPGKPDPFETVAERSLMRTASARPLNR
jgi:cell division protein FtsI/penicillin-binding protein 2